MHKILMGVRPDYFDGQLLDDEDFLREQAYHIEALRRHDHLLHGLGLVFGLEVTRHRDEAVEVSPGFAIDRLGNEIHLDKTQVLDLPDASPNGRFEVRLEREPERKGKSRDEKKERQEYAVLSIVSCRVADSGGEWEDDSAEAYLILADIGLDDSGKIARIDGGRRRYARPPVAPGSIGEFALAAGSVGPKALSPALKTGWQQSNFKPNPIDNEVAGKDPLRPAFRVGTTRAQTPKPAKEGDPSFGAAGSMALPIPPCVAVMTQFRVAGTRNDESLTVELVLTRFDPSNLTHHRETVIKEVIKGAPGRGFYETFAIESQKQRLDSGSIALAVHIDATKDAEISLVAVEFGFDPDGSEALP